MWYVCKNVYFVEGKSNAAFYDLNNNNLYQISDEARILINKVLTSETELDKDQLEYLKKLCQLNLITTEYTEEHSINELKTDTNIEFAWIEITNMCNLKCVHCYDEALCGSGSVMSYEDFCYIINELLRNNIRKIQIIGGEPFILGTKLKKYLDYVIGKFEYIEIFTNGTLISDEYLAYIKKNNIRIALSIYSYEETEHDKITNVVGSCKKSNTTVKKMSELGIEYHVKNVLIKDLSLGTKDTELYELSSKRDIVRLTGRAKLNLISDSLLKRKLITRDTFSFKLTKNMVTKCISGHNCFSRRLYFSTDMTVYPCVMERRLSHGNLRNKILSSLIKKEILSMNKDNIESCKECELRYCCFDCRPDSNGSMLFSKPWYCTYEPENGKWSDVDTFINDIMQ